MDMLAHYTILRTATSAKAVMTYKEKDSRSAPASSVLKPGNWEDKADYALANR